MEATLEQPVQDKMEDRMETVLISDIIADEEFNCRGHIQLIDLKQLMDNIKENGLIQPVRVFEQSGHVTGKKYRLIAGFMRTKACSALGHTAIKAIISEPLSEVEALSINLAENVARTNLNVMQEARTVGRFRDLGLTETKIAEKVNMGRGWVQVRVMLLKFPEDVQKDFEASILKLDDIRPLYTKYIRDSPEAFYEKVRAHKKKRQSGVKGSIDIKTRTEKMGSKCLRKKREMEEMQDHIHDNAGTGLATRVLAWCMGLISTHELVADVRTATEARGRPYTELGDDH
tara:strand:- start:3199 stop:4062 length:864 start_codon:yes stop_codon:yes gene_type:complete